jgi:colanic acid/amylovoran biosynthesis glycosyltransferase
MGIDIKEFDMKPPITPLSTPLKIIQVGRLTDKKAILDSINAVALASKVFPVELVIIGDGELYDVAKELIAIKCAGAYIHLMGRQTQEFVMGQLDNSDVFLLPSVRANSGDMEGVPVALMEAMAKGLITISTIHSGIPELIENEITGFLIEEHNIDELVASLVKVKELTIEETSEIRLKAREVCNSHFNNNVLNRQILELTNQL